MDLKDEIQRWHREEEAKKERELSGRIRALNEMMLGGNFAAKMLEAMMDQDGFRQGFIAGRRAGKEHLLELWQCHHGLIRAVRAKKKRTQKNRRKKRTRGNGRRK